MVDINADEIRLVGEVPPKVVPVQNSGNDVPVARVVPVDNSRPTVVFRATPEISENRAVNFSEISDIRHPGGLLIYIGTPPRTFDISARFVSRTTAEATEAYAFTNLLKSWTMPSKRENTSGGAEWDSGNGGYKNTPAVVRLYGYDKGNKGNFRGIPVVITSLNLSFPPDINYIKTDSGVFVPIIQSVSIALKEARKFSELRGETDGSGGIGFDMTKFKNGELDAW